MDHYPIIITTATLVILTICLMVEYAIRRRKLAEDLLEHARKQRQLATSSAELKDLKVELARKREVAERLPHITKKMTEKLPLDAYPAIAVRCFKEFFHAEKVGYFAPAGLSSEYMLVVGAGFPSDWRDKVRIPSDEGILGLALQKRAIVSRMDPRTSSGRRPSRQSLEDRGVAPDFVAPIFGVSGAVGVVVIEGCPFPLEEERVYAAALADLLSTMLQNAALLDTNRSGAWIDHLTGVANRFYFLQRFENEIRRTKNYGEALALLMFDIDGFKMINDTYGHYAGDVVIKKMAEFVKIHTRSSDLVGRFGGDEFIVLITSATEEQAKTFVDNLKEKIATTDFAIPGSESPLRITVSGGLAMFPSHGQSTSELFEAADKALYESKRQGRNRILLATSTGLADGISTEAGSNQEAAAFSESANSTGSGR